MITGSEKPSYPIWGVDNNILYTQHMRGILRVSANGGTPDMIAEAKGQYIACPRILPDKKTIMFTHISANPFSLQLVLQALQSGEQKVLFAGDTAQYLPTGHILYSLGNNLMPWSWSSDGKTIALTELNLVPLDVDIGTLSVEGDNKHRELLQEKFEEADPQISPDGRWMAYTSNESGKEEIYVRPFPNVNGGRWQVSTGGGSMSLWSPDGRELFYRSGDAVMAVSVTTQPTFKAGKPEVLFRGTYIAPGTEGIPWDISPNGKRFLMMEDALAAGAAATAQAPRKINIVLNWFEELKQRVPVK